MKAVTLVCLSSILNIGRSVDSVRRIPLYCYIYL